MISHDDYIKRRDKILHEDRNAHVLWLNGQGDWEPEEAQQAIDELVLDVIGENSNKTTMVSYELFGAHPDLGLEATMSTPEEKPNRIINRIENELKVEQRSIVKGES